MDGLGELLRSKREQQGMSINQVASELLIPIRKLNDIENDNYSSFDGDRLYLYLYVKKYARFLGLNEEECKRRLDAFLIDDKRPEIDKNNKKDGRKIVPEYRKNKVYKDNNASNYLKVVLSIILIFISIVAVYKGISFLSEDGRFEPNTPKEVDQPTPPLIEDEPKEDIVPEKTTPTVDIIREEEFVFSVVGEESMMFRIVFNNERTWIQLDIDGVISETVTSRIYNQGEVVETLVDMGSTINLRVGTTNLNQYFIYSENTTEPIEIILDENERNHSGGKNYVFKFVKREN